MPHPPFRDLERRIQLLIRGNQPDPFVDLDRHALKEQSVRPHRIFQSDAQPRPGLDTQHHGGLAALQMKVEQRDLGLRGLGQQHRETDGDARCPAAALGVADRDHMPATIDRIGRPWAISLGRSWVCTILRVNGF